VGDLELFPAGVPHELVLTGDGHLTERAQTYLTRRVAGHLATAGRETSLIVWESNAARAMVIRGEWCAECPRSPDCKNVESLTDKPAKYRHQPTYVEGDRITVFRCRECGLITDRIDWPADADQIMEVLNRRPVPDTRYWYPRGHLIAVNHGEPHGQTVDELLAENHAHGVT
jgi:hypothetical protein